MHKEPPEGVPGVYLAFGVSAPAGSTAARSMLDLSSLSRW